MRNREIQGLRGICLLMVFFSHALGIIPFNIMIGTFNVSTSPLRSLWDGQIAVVIFFMISGYFSYISFFKIKEKSILKKYIYFIKNRILRLYPKYAVIITIGFLLVNFQLKFDHDNFSDWFSGFWVHKITFGELVKHIIPVFNFDTKGINPPVWTIQTEFRYTFIVPFILMIISKYNSSIIISAALLISYFIGIFNVLYIFVLGMIIAKDKNKIIPFIQKLKHWQKIIIIFISILLIGFQYNFYYLSLNLEIRSILFLVSIGFFFLFSIILCILKEGKQIKVLNNKFIVMIGNLSYSFYLWHFIILLFIRPIYKYINSYFIYICLAFFFTLIVSLVTEVIGQFLVNKINLVSGFFQAPQVGQSLWNKIEVDRK